MATVMRVTISQRYKELLTHVSSVTRNESSDSVNGILDTVSVSEDLRMVSQPPNTRNTQIACVCVCVYLLNCT